MTRDPESQTKEAKMENYTVDFGSVSVDKETADRLENDAEYAIQWIMENAYIDRIIKERI